MSGFGARRTPSSGGPALIQKIVTSRSQATVDFVSIPATFTDLEVRFMARSNYSGANEVMSIKLNGDGTSGNYTATEYIQGWGAGGNYNSVAATASGLLVTAISAVGSPALHPATGIVTLGSYSGTVFYKQVNANSSFHQAAGSVQQITLIAAGVWKSTAAINRLTFSVPTSFVNGSTFSLYGVGA